MARCECDSPRLLPTETRFFNWNAATTLIGCVALLCFLAPQAARTTGDEASEAREQGRPPAKRFTPSESVLQ